VSAPRPVLARLWLGSLSLAVTAGVMGRIAIDPPSPFILDRPEVEMREAQR